MQILDNIEYVQKYTAEYREKMDSGASPKLLAIAEHDGLSVIIIKILTELKVLNTRLKGKTQEARTILSHPFLDDPDL